MQRLTIPLFTFIFTFLFAFSPRFASAEIAISDLIPAIEQNTGWTIDELKAGLDRLDRLYQNEMRSPDGRVRWHGKMVSQVVDTNAWTTTYVYEDGERLTFPANKPTPHQAVTNANVRLPRPVMTNGIPAKLAAARLTRQAEKDAGVKTVTIETTANR